MRDTGSGRFFRRSHRRKRGDENDDGNEINDNGRNDDSETEAVKFLTSIFATSRRTPKIGFKKIFSVRELLIELLLYVGFRYPDSPADAAKDMSISLQSLI
jgi:hypothetical protein